MALKPVETIYDTNSRDIPAMLRKLADSIEAGELGEVYNAGMVIRCEHEFAVYGWGDITSSELPFLLQIGLFQLTQMAWNYRNG